MVARPAWLTLCLLCLGCQSLPGWAQLDDSPSAESLWEQGQAAMRQGEPGRAIALYEQSLAAAPELTKNHLSLTAAYLELGNQDQACAHLSRYVEANPDDLGIRAHFAELLTRLRRHPEARAEWEHCIRFIQEQGKPAARGLINCHSRLMEIAEDQEDAYGAHLHRGIGLYLLGRECAGLAEPNGELSCEGFFCKAASELTQAHARRPHEARPSWYLYTVWSRLDRRPAALRCLREAVDDAPFSYLTPFEQRGLYLASQAGESAGSAK
jgi:tetratricopeptide (TPR) repeat protein